MRGLMISFTVILFVFSINLVNTMDAQHMAEEGGPGISLFQWSAGETEFDVDSQSFSEVNTDNMNTSYHKYTEPDENPLTQAIEVLWSTLTFAFQGVRFIIETLFYSSLGFHKFLRDFGRPDDITFLPTYIGVVISLFVNITHLLVIVQILGNRDFRAGL